MAFRRAATRRVVRRRRRTAWVASTFPRTNFFGGINVTLGLLRQQDIKDVDTAKLNYEFQVRRVLWNGGVVVRSDGNGATTQFPYGILYAIYVADAEDTDDVDWTSVPGTVLQGHRVLHTGCVVGSLVRSSGSESGYVHPINIDVRVNCKMKQDELLLLGMITSPGLENLTALNNPSVHGVGRVLINKP